MSQGDILKIVERERDVSVRDIKALLKDFREKLVGKRERMLKEKHKGRIDTLIEERKKFKEEIKLVKAQLKYDKRKTIYNTFRGLVMDEIKTYKDWEIREEVAEVLSENNYSKATSIIRKLVRSELERIERNKDKR